MSLCGCILLGYSRGWTSYLCICVDVVKVKSGTDSKHHALWKEGHLVDQAVIVLMLCWWRLKKIAPCFQPPTTTGITKWHGTHIWRYKFNVIKYQSLNVDKLLLRLIVLMTEQNCIMDFVSSWPSTLMCVIKSKCHA